MPKVKTKKVPEDYEKVKPTIEKLQVKLKEAERKALKTETKHSSLWPILKLNHQISRYVYSMYYERKLISKDLYDYLLRQKYVNADLIAKWKKQGYERLCCVNCIIAKEKNHGSTCICRVPRNQLKEEQRESEGCITCGCQGCASTDKE